MLEARVNANNVMHNDVDVQNVMCSKTMVEKTKQKEGIEKRK